MSTPNKQALMERYRHLNRALADETLSESDAAALWRERDQVGWELDKIESDEQWAFITSVMAKSAKP